jgi:glycosyltransferase involved in cell wall biosynthesis
MKIVILVRILWSAGTQKTAIKGAIELTEMGHDVELIFLRKGRSSFIYEPMLKGLKYRIINQDGHKTSFFTPLYTFITSIYAHSFFAPKDLKREVRIDYDLLRKFPKFVESDKPDKVICHDEYAGIGGYLALKKLGIPYDLFLHEHLIRWNPILSVLFDRTRKRVLFNAKRIYVETRRVGDDTELRTGLNCILNPIGFESFDIIPSNQRKKRIVSIYTIANQRVMLDINGNDNSNNFDLRYWFPNFLVQLEKYLPDYEFVIIAGIKSTQKYKEIVDDLGKLDSKVKIYSNLSEPEKLELLKESKYLLRFGINEYGPGMSNIEAISCGVPVIVNKDIGISDLITKSKAGLVLDAVSVKLVADSVKSIDDQSYESLVERVVELRESWTWKDHSRILLG